MPLYEYQCDACGHRFEQIQKFSDPPPSSCPVCSGSVRKLFSSPAIQFKGSGWYVTDYARKGAASSNGNGASPKAPPKDADKKTETAPKTGSSSTGSSSSKGD
jgi:putative FmdB family regulatory protein